MKSMGKKLQGALALVLVCTAGSALADPGYARDGGDVTFGATNEAFADIAGTFAGTLIGDIDNPWRDYLDTQFTRYVVDGKLTFDGSLAVALFNGYKPKSGDRFDLYDWGTTSGTFATIDLSAAPLATGLSWDTSSLYTTGELVVTGVAVVPEPASLAMLLAGIGFLGLATRKRRAASAD